VASPTGSRLGGLIGSSSSPAVITLCWSSCAVSNAAYAEGVGGLVGSHSGLIDRCYAIGDVTAPSATWAVGGLVGYSSSGDVRDSYARGAVTGDSYVGGFIGYVYGGNTLDNCYSTGLVTGDPTNHTGGFAGGNAGTITDCFWDTQTSGQATSDGGTGKTTAQMKNKVTFMDADWDFDTIWNICAGVNSDYPCLVGVTPSCIYAPVVPFIINKAYALARERL